jgi:hypothetical protein
MSALVLLEFVASDTFYVRYHMFIMMEIRKKVN